MHGPSLPLRVYHFLGGKTSHLLYGLRHFFTDFVAGISINVSSNLHIAGNLSGP